MAYVNLGNIKGMKGDSITGVSKTATNGVVDTYSITYDNGATDTFTVTNGVDGHTPVKGIDYFDGADGEISQATFDTALGLKADTSTVNIALGLKADATALTAKANLSNPTFIGLKETSVAMPANDINLATGNLFTKTITGATTLTVSNVPASGTVGYFILQLTNGGAGAITWFSGVKWAGGTPPTLTASGKDILSFYTIDAGTTWNIVSIQKDVK